MVACGGGIGVCHIHRDSCAESVGLDVKLRRRVVGCGAELRDSHFPAGLEPALAERRVQDQRRRCMRSVGASSHLACGRVYACHVGVGAACVAGGAVRVRGRARACEARCQKW